jgi:hypothetical protein
MNCLCHSKTRVCHITLWPYTSFNRWKHSVIFFFSFTRNFSLMRSLIFILVTNLAEQHKMVTLKQSSEANQLTWRDESSLVRFENFQGRLLFTRSPLQQVSPVQCVQSRYFIATPHT